MRQDKAAEWLAGWSRHRPYLPRSLIAARGERRSNPVPLAAYLFRVSRFAARSKIGRAQAETFPPLRS